MPGKEYECKDCGRAFLVDEEEKREPRCPSCEGENVNSKRAGTLPAWILLKNKEGSS